MGGFNPTFSVPFSPARRFQNVFPAAPVPLPRDSGRTKSLIHSRARGLSSEAEAVRAVPQSLRVFHELAPGQGRRLVSPRARGIDTENTATPCFQQGRTGAAKIFRRHDRRIQPHHPAVQDTHVTVRLHVEAQRSRVTKWDDVVYGPLSKPSVEIGTGSMSSPRSFNSAPWITRSWHGADLTSTGWMGRDCARVHSS
jgi:hypothetical protein